MTALTNVPPNPIVPSSDQRFLALAGPAWARKENVMASTAEGLAVDNAVAEPELTIALDPHRPGVERGRLVHYGIPVWALIGHMHGAALDDEEAIAQTADDYRIPPAAVRAAISYYRQHQGPIDALLARNSAATYAVFDE
jgi:uncharacterized protein (DUF433 family)